MSVADSCRKIVILDRKHNFMWKVFILKFIFNSDSTMLRKKELFNTAIQMALPKLKPEFLKDLREKTGPTDYLVAVLVYSAP